MNFSKSDYITKEQMGGISEEQLLFHPQRRGAKTERRRAICMMA